MRLSVVEHERDF